MRREHQRRVPVPAQRRLAGAGLGLNVEVLAALAIVAGERSVLCFGIDDVRIRRVGYGPEPVAALGDLPVFVGRPLETLGARRTAQGVVVLGAAADVVEGERIVDAEAIELGDRQVLEEAPGGGAVEALVEAAVAADEVVVGVLRIDPDRMIVDVLGLFAQAAKALAAVVGDLQKGVHRVDAVELVRIGEDLGVVVAARRMPGALLPAFAAVGGAEEAALVGLGLDDRVDDVRVLRREREADPADVPLGHPRVELAPGLAAVDRLVNGRLGPAADERPDVAATLMRGSIDRIRVARVEQDVGDAGVVTDLEHLCPGLAGVGAAIDAALAAAAPQRPVSRHPDDARVARVDEDAADVLGLLENHLLPRLAAVERAIDTVAVGDAALVVVLAGADPDDVGVLRVDGQGADRVGAFAVENRCPGRAGVGRLPDAARGRSDPPDLGAGRVDRHVSDPPGGESRPDRAQGETGERRAGERPLVFLCFLLRRFRREDGRGE